jgi:hypothetical protein
LSSSDASGCGPDVRYLAEAWPHLPPHIREAIFTLVDSVAHFYDAEGVDCSTRLSALISLCLLYFVRGRIGPATCTMMFTLKPEQLLTSDINYLP